MVRVQMQTQYAGPRGCFQPGTELEVSNEEAEALIAGRYAKPVKRPTTSNVVTDSLPTSTPLDSLNLKAGLLKTLIDAGVTNVEELRIIEDLTEIPGIGESSAKAIKDALEAK